MKMGFPMNVIVASAVRTPVGRAVKGTLRHTRPDDLAAHAMNAAVARVKGLDPKDVEDVVLGCAMPEGEQGLNVARNAVFIAGWPSSVTAETINRFCSSGLQAIVHGAQSVQCGQAEIVVAGGVESMSMVPMSGNKPSLNPMLVEKYPEAYIAMGHTAERVAKRFEVTRDVQDKYALASHMKAVAAIKAGKLAEEIVPVKARVFEGSSVKEIDFAIDESPRADTTLEALAKLKPAFAKDGTVTAGNSSPMNDGAAAAVLLSEKAAQRLDVKPLGRLRGYAVRGVPPDIMGIGPVPAIRALLEQTSLKISDIDLFEINEAFSVQLVACVRGLDIGADRVNVHGGSIALGHPIGASGARILTTLLHALERRDLKRGVAGLCLGGGNAVAMAIERV
jgi:acetyl-CoA acyltransferase